MAECDGQVPRGWIRVCLFSPLVERGQYREFPFDDDSLIALWFGRDGLSF